MSTLKFAKWRWTVILVAAIFMLDQMSKFLIVRNLSAYGQIKLIPGLNLSLALNHGAAFGFLGHAGGWQQWLFISIAVIMSLVITLWIARLKPRDKYEIIALACILGGALGNLVDRLSYGHVVDFIDVYYESWHWYTFNIADIAICLGGILLAWVTFKKP